MSSLLEALALGATAAASYWVAEKISAAIFPTKPDVRKWATIGIGIAIAVVSMTAVAATLGIRKFR